MANLAGITAVVTGASRGAGRGIAEELGAAGATVFVTGRSTRDARTEGLPGSIEETAELVTRAGGRGIAVRCDHTREADVEQLAERVRADGRLDLLVNNAWGGYEAHDLNGFTRPLWEQPTRYWDAMFTAGVRPTLITSAKLAPLLLERHLGLIVNTVAWLEGEYLGNLYYDAAKAAIIRATRDLAQEARELGVAAISLAPGFLRTERVMAAHAQQPFDLGTTESPRYIGRAVCALAADPGILEHTGELLYVGELAVKYGFSDVDGRRPPKFRAATP